MNRFEELIKAASIRPDTVIHLGACELREHILHKLEDTDRVIFVEPDQELAKACANTFGNKFRVKVVSSAVAAKNGRRTLNITNNRRFSSLLTPGKLLEYYPNIEITEKTEVDVITLADLCRDEEVFDSTDNLLVIELHGMEHEVLTSTSIDTLQRFKWIIVQSSKIDLYQPVPDNGAHSTPNAMREAGFTVLVFEENVLPFTNILCIRNDAKVKNIQLVNRAKDIQDRKESLEQNLREQESKIEALQEKHARSVTALEESSLLARSLSEEKDNHQWQIEDLTKTVNDKSVELAKAQTEIQSLIDQRESQQQQFRDLTRIIDAKSDELDKTQTLMQSLIEENASQQRVQELSTSFDVKSGELDKAQSQIQSLTDLKEAQKQITELSNEIAEKSVELGEAHTEVQRLTAELDNRQKVVEKLDKQIEISNKTIEKTSAELEKARASAQVLEDKKDSQQRQLTELTKTVDTRTAELEKARREIESLTTEKAAQQKRVDELTGTVADKTREIKEMQQTVQINNKLVLKSGSDLKDLQRQYQTAQQHQEQQRALLGELTEKLRQASAYYQKLNLQNLVFDASVLEQEESDQIELDDTDDH